MVNCQVINNNNKAMSKKMFAVVLLIISLLVAVFWLSNHKKQNNASLQLIRVGWQPPLATQGQMTEVLKNTDILKNNGLSANFTGFSFGGPQIEAAMAGQLDAIFIGDQPALNLIAKSGNWKIVSRLFYTRTALLVPIGSSINSAQDLKGKSIAMSFGSVAHKESMLKEKEAGLDPNADVKNVNMDALEISNLVQKDSTNGSWGDIDAVAIWEPSVTIFESKNLARVIASDKTFGVMAMPDDFINKNPVATKKFIKSVAEAYAYFAKNKSQANQWYIDDAKLTISQGDLDKISALEPNASAKNNSEINLVLTDDNLKSLQNSIDWAVENKLMKASFEIGKYVDLRYLPKY